MLRLLSASALLLACVLAPHVARADLECVEPYFDHYSCTQYTVSLTYAWEQLNGPEIATLSVANQAGNLAHLDCLNANDPPGVVNGQMIQDIYTVQIKSWMPNLPTLPDELANLDCRSQPPGPQYFVDYSLYEFYMQLWSMESAYCAFYWYSAQYCASIGVLEPIYIGDDYG